MAHVRTTIHTPAERGFDYATTPGNWRERRDGPLARTGRNPVVVAGSPEALRRLKSVLEQGVA